METVINFMSEYDYIMLLAGAFGLTWLVWLPRVLAPLLAPHYDNLSGRFKALLLFVLPTLEQVLLNSWDSVYTEIILPTVQQTETELDDKVWAEIDRRIHARNEQVGYHPVDIEDTRLHG